MADPVALACRAPDAAGWILAAFGLAALVNVSLALLLWPPRRSRR